MEEVPNFWRTEVWHPLSVHFPIALLSFGSLVYLFAQFHNHEKQKSWHLFSQVLIFTGAIAAWIGIYTGDLADGIVSRKICDPTVLKAHENSAYTLSILFSVAAVLLLAQDLPIFKKSRFFLKIIIACLLVAGNGYLFYTGHLGATVVYQQGGGVYHPSENCIEFE